MWLCEDVMFGLESAMLLKQAAQIEKDNMVKTEEKKGRETLNAGGHC